MSARLIDQAISEGVIIDAGRPDENGTVTAKLSFDSGPLHQVMETVVFPNFHKDGLSRADLCNSIAWDVAGKQPTHTATVVTEYSHAIRFTPRDGETPHQALTRVIAARKLENVLRHSEPRAL